MLHRSLSNGSASHDATDMAIAETKSPRLQAGAAEPRLPQRLQALSSERALPMPQLRYRYISRTAIYPRAASMHTAQVLLVVVAVVLQTSSDCSESAPSAGHRLGASR